MTNVYKNITNAIDTNNMPALWQELGKIAKLLLDFNPIETESNAQSILKLKDYDDLPRQIIEDDDDFEEFELLETVRNVQESNKVKKEGFWQVLSLGGMASFMRGAINGTKTTTT